MISSVCDLLTEQFRGHFQYLYNIYNIVNIYIYILILF